MKKIIIALIFLLPIIALLAMTLSVGIVSEAVVISADNIYVSYNGKDVSNGITLILNDDAEFDVEIYPKNVANKKVIWEFDTSLFDMPKENVLHAKKVGTSYVTVKVEDGGSYVSFFVNVISANLDIVMENSSLEVGDADFVRISHSSIDLSSLSFKSSNENVLEFVDGRILAKTAGSAKITVTAKLAETFKSNEILTAEKTITVLPRLSLYHFVTVDTDILNLSELSSSAVTSWNLDGTAIDGDTLDCSKLSYGEHALTAIYIGKSEIIKIIKKPYSTSEKFSLSHNDKLIPKLFSNDEIINIGELPSLMFEIKPVFYRDRNLDFNVNWNTNDTTAEFSSENYGRALGMLFTGSGEINIFAEVSSSLGTETVVLSYFSYLPVEIFSLALDPMGDKLGIKEERIFATESYNRDNEGKLIADENSGYLKTNSFEMKIGYFYPETAFQAFDVSVSDDEIIKVVDTGSKIILEFLKEGIATVTVSVKNSAFNKDISDFYTFNIKEGVAVFDNLEFENALQKREKALIFMSNIATEPHEDLGTWNHDKNENTPEVPRSVEYQLFSSIYGNGFMLYPNYEYYNDYDFLLLTRANDLLIENLTVRIKNNTEIGDVLSDLNNYGTCLRICRPEIGGDIKNVQIRFCRFENGLSAITGSEPIDENNPVIIEGCILKNFLQCGYNFGFDQGPISFILKNNIAYNIQCPVINLYTYKPDLSKKLYFNMMFEGFFDNYNWREKDNMELIGNLTGDEDIDASIKNLINQKLDSQEFEEAYYKYKGVNYINPLMMILTNTAFDFDLTEQFNYMAELGYEKFTPDLGALGFLLNKLNKQNVFHIYAYYCNRSEGKKIKQPYVLPDTEFIENAEMRRQLREGRNEN